MDLQKAAQNVIEENRLLRRILAQLGLEAPEVDKRLKVLREEAAACGGGNDVSIPDNGCGDDCFMQPFQDDETPESTRTSSGPALARERIEVETIDLTRTDAGIGRVDAVANPLQDPLAFDMSLLETVPDFDSSFDISEFLDHEPVILFPPFKLVPTQLLTITFSLQLDLPPPPSESSIAPDQQMPVSPSLFAISEPPTAVPPLDDSRTMYEPKIKSTTPCTEAYALLKALNARREEHKDMFEIVIELWNGFCLPEDGEGEGKGCRVDNEALQKVIDGMKR